MKIKQLSVTNYKNLDAHLTHHSDLLAFIGNNGSGKSNLLEAISLIFRSHFVSKYKVLFDYRIEYLTSRMNTVLIEKTGKSMLYYLNNEPKNASEMTDHLPKKVVGIYSGEETRLYEDCYEPFFTEFVSNINKAQTQGTVYSELPRMLYLNRSGWNISFLCLLLSDSPDNKQFLSEIFHLSTMDGITIKIDFISRNYSNYNDNQAMHLIRHIDSKSEYKLSDLKQLLEQKGYSPDEVFKYLYLAYTPNEKKIIDSVTIAFANGQSVSDFSEGEKKLILIKGALEFAGQEDSVFILDEPDSHIHINNKAQITSSFEAYLHNRQIIVTTHSPTLTQAVKDENVYMLNNGRIEDRTRQQIIEEVTGDFWNKHQQGSFLSTKKPIVLLVEGIHDKEHITNAHRILHDEFPDLDFEIFVMDSACNIPPMMVGLRTCDIKFNKLFIAVFDDDTTGRTELDKTKVKFPYEENSKRHKLGYFAITYPAHGAFHKTKSNADSFQFTVENMFDALEYQNAYKEALELYLGKFDGKSLDKIHEDIKDKSKAILFAKSKSFTSKEDFTHFRKLFDLIRDIKNYSDGLHASVVGPVVKITNLVKLKTEPPANTKTPQIKTKKPSAKANHLAYWTAFRDYVATQNVSFTVQKPRAQHWTNITIGKSNFRLAVIANTQKKWIAVQLLCLNDPGKLNFLVLESLYKSDAKETLHPQIEWKGNDGKKEHHINLVFHGNDPFDMTDWNKQHALLTDWTEKFHTYFEDKVKRLQFQ